MAGVDDAPRPQSPEGDIVKNRIFLILMCALLLVAIAGLMISSARLIGLFG